MVADHHWYDLLECNYESKNRAIFHFRKSKQSVVVLDVCSFNMLTIIQAICTSYHRVTLGYSPELCCKFQFYPEYTPPKLHTFSGM